MEIFPNRRRSIRLKEFDYAQIGAYAVTLCTQDRKCVFGDVWAGRMVLNEVGKIAESCWREIPEHFQNVELDSFVFMPNHMHGLVNIVGARHAVPLREQFGHPTIGTIPTIIRSFKSVATKRIHETCRFCYRRVWQRNYYEHVIRNANDLVCAREYIIKNPLRWDTDEYCSW